METTLWTKTKLLIDDESGDCVAWWWCWLLCLCCLLVVEDLLLDDGNVVAWLWHVAAVMWWLCRCTLDFVGWWKCSCWNYGLLRRVVRAYVITFFISVMDIAMYDLVFILLHGCVLPSWRIMEVMGCSVVAYCLLPLCWDEFSLLTGALISVPLLWRIDMAENLEISYRAYPWFTGVLPSIPGWLVFAAQAGIEFLGGRHGSH